MEVFVKYNFFHKEQRPRYTPSPFHAESLYYNADEPQVTLVCIPFNILTEFSD